MVFLERETLTIVAALMHWIDIGGSQFPPSKVRPIFDGVMPLSEAEIRDVCRRLQEAGHVQEVGEVDRL